MKLTLQHLVLMPTLFVMSHFSSAAIISGKGTWEGTLFGRDLDGNGETAEAYYDSVQNITWLADANYAQTSGHLVSSDFSRKTYALSWVNSLDINGYSEWRLPSVGNDLSPNYHLAGELNHLRRITLGHTYLADLVNTGPFLNMLPRTYWYREESGACTYCNWGIQMSNGATYKRLNDLGSAMAWAVADGDIGAAVVPIPAGAWLFGSALAGLLVARSKNKK